MQSQPDGPFPVGYVVPLRDNGAAAHSYVFAVTRSLAESAAHEDLAGLSTFTGHDMPYRAEEVLRIHLGTHDAERLPANLFLRDLFLQFDWSNPLLVGLSAAFHEEYRAKGHRVGRCAFAAVFREGVRPDNGLSESDGALWREARLTVFVDLDAMHYSEAERATMCTVGDFARVSGAFPFEKAVLDGRAQEWNPESGTFRSPEETRERYQEERWRALARLSDTTFRTAVYPRRWPLVRQALAERAAESGVSLRQEFCHAVGSSLELAVSQRVPHATRAFLATIRKRPPRRMQDLAGELAQFREMVIRTIRPVLARLLVDDLLGPESRKQHDALARYKASEPSVSDPVELDVSPEEALVDQLGSELWLRIKHTLTPKETLVLFAQIGLRAGESLAGWARAHGMAPATASVHLFKAKNKIRAAQKRP
jgi:hypothetical protein